jgi:hypothetical protein
MEYYTPRRLKVLIEMQVMMRMNLLKKRRPHFLAFVLKPCLEYIPTIKLVTEVDHVLSTVPYFPAHKTHPDFFVRNFRKNND